MPRTETPEIEELARDDSNAEITDADDVEGHGMVGGGSDRRLKVAIVPVTWVRS